MSQHLGGSLDSPTIDISSKNLRKILDPLRTPPALATNTTISYVRSTCTFKQIQQLLPPKHALLSLWYQRPHKQSQAKAPGWGGPHISNGGGGHFSKWKQSAVWVYLAIITTRCWGEGRFRCTQGTPRPLPPIRHCLDRIRRNFLGSWGGATNGIPNDIRSVMVQLQAIPSTWQEKKPTWVYLYGRYG